MPVSKIDASHVVSVVDNPTQEKAAPINFKDSSTLITHVRILEGRTSPERGDIVLNELDKLGLKPQVQSLTFPRVRNIIVDFKGLNKSAPSVIFSAHYDVFSGSPGANDNASGVAVLLGLCSELSNNPYSVRVIFFDREEAWLSTPIVNLGLLGSLIYTFSHSLEAIRFVYNVEFCGQGENLVVWPIRREKSSQNIFNW